MPVKRDKRSEDALTLRATDPEAWDRLHPTVKDEAQIYADIRSSERQNEENLKNR